MLQSNVISSKYSRSLGKKVLFISTAFYSKCPGPDPDTSQHISCTSLKICLGNCLPHILQSDGHSRLVRSPTSSLIPALDPFFWLPALAGLLDGLLAAGCLVLLSLPLPFASLPTAFWLLRFFFLLPGIAIPTAMRMMRQSTILARTMLVLAVGCCWLLVATDVGLWRRRVFLYLTARARTSQNGCRLT